MNHNKLFAKFILIHSINKNTKHIIIYQIKKYRVILIIKYFYYFP